MANRGTASTLTSGQRAEFLGASIRALSLIADKMNPKLAVGWSVNGQHLKLAFMESLFLKVPETEVPFDFQVNYDIANPVSILTEILAAAPSLTSNVSMSMASKTGIHEHLARLMYFTGSFRDFDAFKDMVRKDGYMLLDVHAVMPFLQIYGLSDCNEAPIAFGGSEININGGKTCLVTLANKDRYIRREWQPELVEITQPIQRCRWLVAQNG